MAETMCRCCFPEVIVQVLTVVVLQQAIVLLFFLFRCVALPNSVLKAQRLAAEVSESVDGCCLRPPFVVLPIFRTAWMS